ADVLLAHADALAPPGVMALALLEVAEGVDPTRADPTVELLALDGREAARLHVLLGAREVDLLMGRVEVAHDEDGPALDAILLEEVEDAPVERELVGDTAEVPVLAVAVREVGVHDEELTKARELKAPL